MTPAVALTLLLALAPPPPPELSSPAARERLRVGLDAARAGDTAAAASVFRDLAERAPADLAAVARYNLASLALQHTSDAPPADLNPVGRLRAVDLSTDDTALRRDARFNLAHSLLPPDNPADTGRADELDQLQAQIEASLAAADIFRSCLDLDPSDLAAARNAERLHRRVEQLRQQQEQIRKQRELAQKLADALQQLADQQRAEADDPTQGPQQDGSTTADQTSAATERLRQLAQQAAQSGDQTLADAAQRAAEQTAQAQQRQDDAAQSASAGNNASRRDQQQQAADALDAAAQQLRDAADGDQPQDGTADGQGGSSPNARGTPDQPADDPADQQAQDGTPEGDPIARMLLEKERRERVARELRESRRGTPIPVEKDW